MQTDSTPQAPEIVAAEVGPATAASPNRVGAKFSSNRDVAVVQADYLALANDLEQAQALGAALEMQLSGKTNELAQFKLIWERTQSDLVKFAQDLDTMRKERHSLANEVQCAYAFEHKYEKLKVTHQNLETTHGALVKEHEILVAKVAKLESEIMRERSIHVQTRLETDELRLKTSNRVQPMGLTRDADLRNSLESLREQLNRVLGGGGHGGGHGSSPAPAPSRAEPEHIAIEFGA